MAQKPRFLDGLSLSGGLPGEWEVLSDMRYVDGKGTLYTVEKGFVTDLASIPRPTRAVFDVNGRSRKPAVLHDWFYYTQRTTRREADALFLEALESEGQDWITRWLFWTAVRAGGWVYWNSRRKDISH